MRPSVRPLVGEQYLGFELSIPAAEPESYEKLLKQAARVCKATGALSFTLSDPVWRQPEDTMVVKLVVSL